MKRKFSICLLLWIAIVYALPCTPQNIAFAYDNAGNRTKREIVVSTQKIPGQSGSGVGQYFDDTLSDKDIRIHPNITGLIKLEIMNYDNDDKGILSLYNTAGVQIISKEINNAETDVDISSYPGGIYILQIVINGRDTSWKIIKE